MSSPEFDGSTGWWFIRYRTGEGKRVKKTLQKDPRWTRGGEWPGAKKPKCPPEVQVLARPFQDIDTAARLGHAVKVPRLTDLKGFLDGYKASYRLSQKPTSLRQLDYAIRVFLAFCEAAKVRSVEQVDRKLCRTFLDGLASKGRSYNSVKGVKGMLGGAFRRAVEDHLIDTNPWHQLKTPGRNDSEGTPSWTAEDIAALKGALKGWHRDMFIVGINCGFRCHALVNLDWGDVKWSQPRRKFGRLHCRKEFSKTGKAYSVPLVGELHDVLMQRNAEATATGPHDKIFPGQKPGRGVGASTFAVAVQKACEEAGVKYRGSPWHSMRATFATQAHARGANPRAIQAWMNHTSIQMTDKYSHYSAELDDKEAEKLEAAQDQGD